MQIVSIIFTLGILVFIGLYLYAPFLERRARRVTAEEHELSALLAERERMLNALQELDFDYKLGKVPEEDYPTQRASLLQKGAEILKRLGHTPKRVPLDQAELVTCGSIIAASSRMSRSLHCFSVGHHSSSSRPSNWAVNRAGSCPARSAITSVRPTGVSGSTSLSIIAANIAV